METRKNGAAPEARSFGRRAFLAGSAAALGMAAASGLGCTPDDSLEEKEPAEAPEEQVYQGLCRGNCSGGCRMNVHVRDGKVVKTSPVKEENEIEELICPRGLSHAQRVYAPERLQYPMRRIEGTPRGGGEWERLTWDEAITYITDKWKGYIAEYGGSSIGFTFGAGTYSNNYYAPQRVFNCLGATKIAQDNDQAALKYGWRIFGMSQYLIGNPMWDQVNSRTIVAWCCNATISTLVRWKYMRKAMENGAKLVVIDPIYTDLAAKADKWIVVKPGTDGALALGMMRQIIEEGRAAEDYLTKMSVAPFLVREDNGKFLRLIDLGIEPDAFEEAAGGGDHAAAWGATSGTASASPAVAIDADGNWDDVATVANPCIRGAFEIEGIKVKTAYQLLIERVSEWTLEKTAEVTEVPVETIRELIDLYLDGPTSLHLGFGNDHWGNGDSISHAQFTLHLVAGMMGIKGGSVMGTNGGATTTYYGENWGAVYPAEMFTVMPGPVTSMNYLPGIMETGTWNDAPLTIKSMFFWSCNPLGSHAGRTALIEAWDKIELIIGVDTVMNDSINYADVVLPHPHWFEFETYRTCPQPYIDIQEKCIEPQFECKSDVEIMSLLGTAMGIDNMDWNDDTFNREFLNTEASVAAGTTWDDLKEKKRVRFAPEEYYYGSEAYPYITVTGRAEFYLEDVAPCYDQTQQLDTRLLALPFYEEPMEAYDGNPLKEKYPITIMTHRDKFKVHTAFSKCPWFLEIQPEPTVELNPADAEARGIAEGDYVRCFNDRGSVVMRAHLDAGMRPGFTWTEHTWLEDQYVDGHYNSLTSVQVKHYYPTCTPFDVLCQIEKYEKEA